MLLLANILYIDNRKAKKITQYQSHCSGRFLEFKHLLINTLDKFCETILDMLDNIAGKIADERKTQFAVMLAIGKAVSFKFERYLIKHS